MFAAKSFRRRKPLARRRVARSFECLEPRQMLTSFFTEIPRDSLDNVELLAVAQGPGMSDVYLGAWNESGVYGVTANSDGTAVQDFSMEQLPFLPHTAVSGEHRVGDSIYLSDGTCVVGGESPTMDTGSSLGTPTVWVDGVPYDVGYEHPTLPNGGDVFGFSHTDDIFFAGTDRRNAIAGTLEGSTNLSDGNLDDFSLGGDTNGEIVTATDPDDAIYFKKDGEGVWQLHYFEKPTAAGYTAYNGYGYRMSQDGYVGGWYEYYTLDYELGTVGVIWDSDGEIVETFDFADWVQVRNVLPGVASMNTAEESFLYFFEDGRLVSASDYVQEVAGITLPDEANFVEDMEWNNDGTAINFVLSESNFGDRGRQFLLHLEDGLPGVDDSEETVEITGPEDAVPFHDQVFTLGVTEEESGGMAMLAAASASEYDFQVDWDGDGTVDETVTGPSGTEVSHAFSEAGTFNVTVTAFEEGVQVGEPTTHVVEVTTSLMRVGSDGENILIVAGTASADNVSVYRHGDDVQLRYSWSNRVTYEDVDEVEFWAGPGNDRVSAWSFSTGITIYGGEGNDYLYGGRGNDYIDGGAGRDHVHGSSGDDVLLGGSGRDYLFGSSGDDTILGGEDQDIIFGSQGDDILRGGEGNDHIFSGSGNDALIGGDGRDFLFAQSGRNLLIGGTGRDYLFSGSGHDLLIADSTVYDDDDAAIVQVLEEWTAPGRIEDCAAAVAVWLNDATVNKDHERDYLFARWGAKDWGFWDGETDRVFGRLSSL